MLRPRIIPCLLVHNGGLVKTVRFRDPKYVGDPVNAVRIFNEKEVDEIIVLDIDATVQKREPNYSLIMKLAAECRMPLCYGGGVKTPKQVDKIISLGVEKVAISSGVISNYELISESARLVGQQSIVVVMDVMKRERDKKYSLWTHNARIASNIDPFEFAKNAEKYGAGEIVVNSITHDGTMGGYDINLAKQVRYAITIPMTVLGGAGSIKDIKQAVDELGIVGAAAGSLFVFKGKYKAVLISYPNNLDKESIARKTNYAL